VLQEWHEACAV
jgi:hypothetical protein